MQLSRWITFRRSHCDYHWLIILQQLLCELPWNEEHVSSVHRENHAVLISQG